MAVITLKGKKNINGEIISLSDYPRLKMVSIPI